MSKLPLVSVIVPIYNTAQYLERCIRSILQQTYKFLEIILVDDGSTDSSSIICNVFSSIDRRVKAYHKKNGGSGSARNFGLRMAFGEYISFIDSDDWVEKEYIEELISPMIEDQLIDISIGVYIRDGADGNQKHLFQIDNPHYIDKMDALVQLMSVDFWGAGGCMKLYRAKLFDQFICNERLLYGEDLADNFLLFKQARRIFYSGVEKYHYVDNPQSLTHIVSPQSAKHFLEWIICLRNSPEISTNYSVLRNAIGLRALSFYHEIMSNWFFSDILFKKSVMDNLHQEMYISIGDILGDFSENKIFGMIYTRFVHKNSLFEQYVSMIDELKNAIRNGKRIYIYGAGSIGKKVSDFFKINKIEFEGFLVSKTQDKNIYEGKRVYQLYDLLQFEPQNCSIILGMNDKHISEVYTNIVKNNFGDIFVW